MKLSQLAGGWFIGKSVIREGVGYIETQLSCILFIMLTTTCFGHCGPSSGHKNVYRGNYPEYDHSVNAYNEISMNV